MLRRLGELACLTILGLAFARLCLGVVDNRWWSTPALLAGWADRPYVYRQFTPLLIRALSATTGWASMQSAAWVLRAACIGWLWALYAWARAVLPPSAALTTALLAPLFILPFVVGAYVYDVPHLALTTLALALLARRQWTAYLALFPWLVLSRETAILLVPVYALLARPALPPFQIRWAVLSQLAAAVVVKAVLAWHFAANPGALLETHLIEQYAWLKHDRGVVVGLALLAALVIALVVRRRRAPLPASLEAVTLLIPAYFAAFILFGYPGELRAVVEVYPVLYLIAFYLVWAALTRQPAPRSVLGQLALRRQLPAGAP
jgi:hypothetical protein